LCGPKGASFLYVKKKHQHWVKPLIYSWGKEGDDPGPSEFLQDFQWQGTRDMAAFLSIPSAIEFYYSYLEKNLKLCRENIKYAFKNLGLTLKTEPISNGGDWIGQMVSHPLPESTPLDLKEILYHHYKIEIPIFKWGDRMFIRVSMQIYNEKKEVDLLLSALSSIF
jgi:isopenicillin-N epimerase